MSAKRDKPAKPYPEFPLFAHASGHWAKKIRGRTRYFGRWDGPSSEWRAALERFNEQRDALYAGQSPASTDGFTVGLALDRFLSAKMRLLQSSELAPRTYHDYDTTCTIVAECFGTRRLVASLTTDDFGRLRAQLAARFGPVRLTREIVQVRMLFKYAWEAGYMERPLRLGPEFKLPKQRELRAARQRWSRIFTAQEVRTLIAAARLPIRAMVLLGINCGFGNDDCARLETSHLDFNIAGGWHNMPRPKTGVPRRCPLWGETVAALRDSTDARPCPRGNTPADLVFVTKFGNAWRNDTHSNPIADEFRVLLDATQLYQPKRTFYALRHTFATIAGASQDQVAVNHIMGHTDRSIAGVYREHIDDERLIAVVNYVRRWLQK